MSQIQVFAVILGGWVIFLALLVWALLLKPKVRPTSIKSALLILAITTGFGILASTGNFGMTLAVAAMAFVGVLIGEIATIRWVKTHSNQVNN